MKEFYFERLKVWEESREMVEIIYKVTSQFPKEEKYALTSQIRRATTSISANIAEGMTRQSDKSKARFINIAFGSAIEVINFLILARDLKYPTNNDYTKLRSKTEKITNQLNALYNRLK